MVEVRTELNNNCENHWLLVGITSSTSRSFPGACLRLLMSHYQSVSSHGPFCSTHICRRAKRNNGRPQSETLGDKVHVLGAWVTMFMSWVHVLIGEDIHRSQGSAWSEPETCHSKVRGLSSIIGLKANTKPTMATSVFLPVGEWWTVNSSHSH